MVASDAITPCAAAPGAARGIVISSNRPGTGVIAVVASATVNCFAAAIGTAGGIVISNICSGTADIASAAGPALAAS